MWSAYILSKSANFVGLFLIWPIGETTFANLLHYWANFRGSKWPNIVPQSNHLVTLFITLLTDINHIHRQAFPITIHGGIVSPVSGPRRRHRFELEILRSRSASPTGNLQLKIHQINKN